MREPKGVTVGAATAAAPTITRNNASPRLTPDEDASLIHVIGGREA